MTEASLSVPAHGGMHMDYLLITNYRNLSEVNIIFPDGLIGILGENGRGKSSLLNGIAVALYGQSAAPTTKDLLIGPGSEDARIEFGFSLDAARYAVVRKLRKRDLSWDAELFIDGRPEPLVKGTDPVNAEIIRLLGGQREMMISRFVRQKQLDELSEEESAKRIQLILKLLGVSSVNDAATALTARHTALDRLVKERSRVISAMPGAEAGPLLRELRASLAALVRRLDGLPSELALADGLVARREAELAVMDAGAGAAASFLTTLELVNERLTELARDEQTTSARLASIEGAAAKLAEVDALVADIVSGRAEFEALEDAWSLRRRLPDLVEQRAAVAERLGVERAKLHLLGEQAAREPGLLLEEAELGSTIERLSSESAIADRERSSEVASIARVRESKREAQAQLAGLATAKPGDMTCPTCLQTVADLGALRAHHEQRIAELDIEEAAIIERGSAAKSTIERCATERSSAERALVRVRADIAAARDAGGEQRLLAAAVAERETVVVDLDEQVAQAEAIPYDPERHAELSAQAASLASLSEVRADLRGNQAEATRLVEERERQAQRRTTLEAQAAKTQAAAEAAGYHTDQHDAARAAAAEARAARTKLTVEQSEMVGERRLIEERIDRAEGAAAEHASRRGELESVLAEKGAVALTRETMSRFRLSVIGKVRPALARRASSLLRDLTDGRYSELALDDDYDIQIGNAGTLYTIKRFSGGEADLANLCLRLAISELISESRGLGSVFIVLDEVLSSQDQRRQDNIMDALPALAKRFSQVLMVSHVPNVQDRFPHAIRPEWDPLTETSRFIFPA